MIYGVDGREAASSSGARGRLARSTAISVLSSLRRPAGPGLVKLDVDTLKGYVCEDEKFSDDISLSYSCTGFLIAPDLIATAGHCMVNVGQSRNQSGSYCEIYSWLFDYRDSIDVNAIPEDKFYSCKRIVYAVQSGAAPFSDFAIVQLDRPVMDRDPLRWADREPAVGESVFTIGYPLGSPAKISGGGQVLLNDFGHQHIVTSLDAFEGNSGSPVFNEDAEVVGILIGAVPHISLYEDPTRHCHSFNRCDDQGLNCALPDRDTALFPEFQRTGTMVQRAGLVRDLMSLPRASL